MIIPELMLYWVTSHPCTNVIPIVLDLKTPNHHLLQPAANSWPNTAMGLSQQTKSVLITPPNFKLLSWNIPPPPIKQPFVVSCGIPFHSCWWNNILIRKQSPGQPGSFPFSLALSCLFPSTTEKKRVHGEGELTCLSDSLLCSRIKFLQLTAYWLCDISTKSDLATDLNAKWTLQPWTTFFICVRLLLSNLKAARILSPLHILPNPVDLFRRWPGNAKMSREAISQWSDIQVWLFLQRGLLLLS